MESTRFLPVLRVLSAHGVEFVEMELGDVTIRVLRLDRLIQAKEFAGRPKDLAALPALRAALDLSRKS